MALTLLLLNPYVDAILAIALGICIGGILDSLAPYIAKIPFVGGSIANVVTGMANAIRRAANAILSPISDAVGGTFHQAARLVDWTYGEFSRHSKLILEAATGMLLINAALHEIRKLVHQAVSVADGFLPRVKTLEKEWHGIEHRVRVIEREIGAGIGHDIRIHVKALEKWEKAAKAQLKANEKAITQTLPGEISDLESFLGIKPLTKYLDWAAGIVTAAIGLDVFNLLRCPGLTNLAKKYRCGLWNALGNLLPLGILLTVAFDFEDFVKAAETVADGIGTAVAGIEGVFTAELPPLPPPQ